MKRVTTGEIYTFSKINPLENDYLKNVQKRLTDIENIICDEDDEYDLDRLETRYVDHVTLRDEIAEQFKITKNIPIDRLREIVKMEINKK